MPSRSKSKGTFDKKPAFGVLGRPALGSGCVEGVAEWKNRNLLSSALPALASRPRLIQRAYSTLSFGGCDAGISQPTSEGRAQPPRSAQERERNPDRISLDRRGLSTVPALSGEERIRLLSLQHNLICRLEGFPLLPRLVFLDLYDNQVERLSGLGALTNLRVLLLGKNRVRRLDGLEGLSRLEVLDLHGNQLSTLGSGLSTLSELKVLNVAGNQLRSIINDELQGLAALEELNLRRNRLRRVDGVANAPNLNKLFLSNNNIQSVTELVSAVSAATLHELSVDGNAACEQHECAPLLVSALPHLRLLNGTEVTPELRAAATGWRTGNKSQPQPAQVSDKKQAISNARMHWELLRSQTRSLIRICAGEQDDSISTNNLAIRRSKNLTEDCSTGELGPLRLPPILVPLMGEGVSSSSSSARSSTGGSSTLRCDSVLSNSATSSVEPNVDSCTSSPRSDLLEKEGSAESNSSSDDENESGTPPQIRLDVAESSSSQPSITSRPYTAQPKLLSTSNRAAAKSTLVKTRSRTAHQREKISNTLTPPSANNLVHRSSSRHKSVNHTGKTREQGGDYLVEIEGRCLNVYGQAAIKFLDRPWNPIKATEVQTVRFNYISYNSVATQFAKLRQRFPSIENFIFRESNLYCFAQLNALAELQGLTSLTVEQEGNPIAHKDWKTYAVYRLAHWGLNKLNGEEISTEMIAEAEEQYAGLGAVVLHCLPGSLLLPLLGRLTLEAGRPGPPPSPRAAKEWLLAAEPTLRNVVAKEALQWRRGVPSQEELAWRQRGRTHLSAMLEAGCSAADKLRVLEVEWPDMLTSLIQDTLVDFSQLDVYMKRCMSQLRF